MRDECTEVSPDTWPEGGDGSPCCCGEDSGVLIMSDGVMATTEDVLETMAAVPPADADVDAADARRWTGGRCWRRFSIMTWSRRSWLVGAVTRMRGEEVGAAEGAASSPWASWRLADLGGAVVSDSLIENAGYNLPKLRGMSYSLGHVAVLQLEPPQTRFPDLQQVRLPLPLPFRSSVLMFRISSSLPLPRCGPRQNGLRSLPHLPLDAGPTQVEVAEEAAESSKDYRNFKFLPNMELDIPSRLLAPLLSTASGRPPMAMGHPRPPPQRKGGPLRGHCRSSSPHLPQQTSKGAGSLSSTARLASAHFRRCAPPSHFLLPTLPRQRWHWKLEPSPTETLVAAVAGLAFLEGEDKEEIPGDILALACCLPCPPLTRRRKQRAQQKRRRKRRQAATVASMATAHTGIPATVGPVFPAIHRLICLCNIICECCLCCVWCAKFLDIVRYRPLVCLCLTFVFSSSELELLVMPVLVGGGCRG